MHNSHLGSKDQTWFIHWNTVWQNDWNRYTLLFIEFSILIIQPIQSKSVLNFEIILFQFRSTVFLYASSWPQPHFHYEKFILNQSWVEHEWKSHPTFLEFFLGQLSKVSGVWNCQFKCIFTAMWIICSLQIKPHNS